MNDFKVRSDWMPFCVPDISDAEVQAVSDTALRLVGEGPQND